MKKILIICLLAISLIANATKYYIDPSGSDASGTGAKTKPWKTLYKACSVVYFLGDTIHVNPGTYVETQQSNLAIGVSIEGEGSTSIIHSDITSEWEATINLHSGVEGTNGNQTISYIKMEGGVTAWGAIMINARSNVKIHHCTFVDFAVCGVTFNGKVALYDPTPPAIYATGNEFSFNTITNSSSFVFNNYGNGCLQIGGQDGMLTHDNTITQNSRTAGYNGYCIKYFNEGYNRGIKIYNNTLIRETPTIYNWDWNFAIEFWNHRGGVEIYNNIIYGSIDVGGDATKRGSYDYTIDIHDNIIGYTTLQTNSADANNGGVFIERAQEGPLYIRNNLFRNIATPIQLYPSETDDVNDIYIYNNVFSGVGITSGGSNQTLITWATVDGLTNVKVNNFNFINNTVYAGSGGAGTGIRLPNVGTAKNIKIRNNIIEGFADYAIYSDLAGSATIDILSIENNILYGNGTNTPAHTGKAPTNNTTLNNIVVNPLFVSSSDFHLQAGSPAIGAGIGVGLATDRDGNAYFNPPSIGAYEYNSSPPPAAVPVYVSSIIEDATPTTLAITYSLSLANIVPSTSAFNVLVNSVARIVNTVVISGTKMFLTLASPVIFGDVVTIAYTKPAINPLQTVSGGQAATITAQTVTNNVASSLPVYVSSVVTNATPSILEMTYNLTLANIIPNASAFTVKVNSVTRTVSAVAISGTKVMLTLATPIVSGEIITVAYTKPASNPLQTSSGGQAASITAQTVTNNVGAVSPVYVSSLIANATPSVLEMTYNLTLANIVPAASAFTVKVNAVTRTVNTVAISGTTVLLTLASAVGFGDVVTVAYTKPANNPIQTPAGGQAATITAQAVTNNVNPVNPVYISSIVKNATPSELEMTYNLTLANIVPATSAFTVLVNSVTRTINSVAISGTNVILTLSSAVVFGDVITVAYTKPGSNFLQTPSGGQAASISAQPVTNLLISPTLPVYVGSVIENATPDILEITYSLSLINLVPAISAFSVLVNSGPRLVNSITISGTKVQLTLASPVVYGDVVTVSYAKPATNPLQTASGGEAASISNMLVTNNVNPVNPVYISSVVKNATPSELEMTYNLTLANIVPATSAFTVMVNSVTRAVNTVAISGTKVLLTLASAVVFGDVVTIAYTKPASNPIQTPAGGQATTITSQIVTNNVQAINQSGLKVTIFPNPTKDSFTITLEGETITEPITIRILDISGKILYEDLLTPAPISTNLNSGIYAVQFISAGAIFDVEKLMVIN